MIYKRISVRMFDTLEDNQGLFAKEDVEKELKQLKNNRVEGPCSMIHELFKNGSD